MEANTESTLPKSSEMKPEFESPLSNVKEEKPELLPLSDIKEEKPETRLPAKRKPEKPLENSHGDYENNNNHHFDEGASNQIIPYRTPDKVENDVTAEHGESLPPSANSSNRGLSIGAFTVQCAACRKWRLIPSKEKYEEIREHILDEPFVCEQAREWKPNVSCEDPEDITPDDSRLWAIDKPCIRQPPLGWERLIRIRGEGGTRFADVYYTAPNGKRLRSMVQIERYLTEHPEYVEQGVTLSQFSFQTPRPLREDYVKKRIPARLIGNGDSLSLGLSGPLEPQEVTPISSASPADLDAGHSFLPVPTSRPPSGWLQATPPRGHNSSEYSDQSPAVENSQPTGVPSSGRDL